MSLGQRMDNVQTQRGSHQKMKSNVKWDRKRRRAMQRKANKEDKLHDARGGTPPWIVHSARRWIHRVPTWLWIALIFMCALFLSSVTTSIRYHSRNGDHIGLHIDPRVPVRSVPVLARYSADEVSS